MNRHEDAAACNCGGNHSAIVGFDGPGNGHAVTCPVRTAASTGAELIAAERQRQIDAEGWTPDHDDCHTLGELAAAGACYALLGTRWKDSAILGEPLVRSILWPWEDEWFKPTDYPEPPYTANVHLDRHQRDLVKAGALIAAEIDRLERTRRGS